MNGAADSTTFIFRIVVKFAAPVQIPYTSADEISACLVSRQLIQWPVLLNKFAGTRIDKLFTTPDAAAITALEKKALAMDTSYQAADLKRYFVIMCPACTYTIELLQTLQESADIELAYLQNSPAYPPSGMANDNFIHSDLGYLNAAPEGIDARFAWTIEGGDGKTAVKLIDIEQGWILDHVAMQLTVPPCFGINHYLYEDHGTAVMGIIMMRDIEKKMTGIVPQTNGGIVSQWRPNGSFNTPDAIVSAIGLLNAGDILLLESQTFDSFSSQNAWPIEIEEATFQTIRLATALGIIVIEAAGNGNRSTNKGNDLDLYNSKGKNIFLPGDHYRDSGAIMVAAASAALPHSKINCSNYGKRINCYAWGEHVATAGYYPGSSGAAINTYTKKFCGTSSAAAIIAGAAVALQSIVTAHQMTHLSPKQMRNFLSSVGTQSANGASTDKIGMMPDLQKIIRHILPTLALQEKIQ